MIFNFDNNKLYYEFLDRHKWKTAVLLHGWGGDHQSLYKILESFENFNILTLDFWGFGRSDKPKSCYDIYSYSKAVFELIKALNLNHLTLVGHSFGGRISIIISAENPELIDNLILIDSAGIKPNVNFKKIVKNINYKLSKFLVKHHLKKSVNIKKYASNDYQKLTREEQIIFNRIINEDLTNYLDFIKAKTLIIWGQKDKDTPLYMAKILNKHIENSTLKIIKNATHFVYLEESKKTNQIIKDFLK